MHIICLTPLEEGVYNDHASDHILTVPEGWAMIPDDMVLPNTFPRLGSIDSKKVNGIMTVVSMTEGTMPELVEPEPTEMELLRNEIESLKLELTEVKKLLV